MGCYYNSTFICACNLSESNVYCNAPQILRNRELGLTKKWFRCSGIRNCGRKVEHSGWWIQMQNVWTSKSKKPNKLILKQERLLPIYWDIFWPAVNQILLEYLVCFALLGIDNISGSHDWIWSATFAIIWTEANSQAHYHNEISCFS